MAGFTNSFGAGSFDMYIVKLDVSGTLLWSRTAGGTGSDVAYSIIQTTDGGYSLAGSTISYGSGNNDFYIVKLDAGGNICGNTTSPTSTSGTGGTATSPTSIVNSPTSTVMLPSPSSGTGGTLTTICVIGIQPISKEIPERYNLEQNYPNPFNPSTKIKFSIPPYKGGQGDVSLKIYDLLGHEVATLVNDKLQPGTYQVEFDGTNFSSGIYLYKLTTENYTETKKMVLIK